MSGLTARIILFYLTHRFLFFISRSPSRGTWLYWDRFLFTFPFFFLQCTEYVYGYDDTNGFVHAYMLIHRTNIITCSYLISFYCVFIFLFFVKLYLTRWYVPNDNHKEHIFHYISGMHAWAAFYLSWTLVFLASECVGKSLSVKFLISFFFEDLITWLAKLLPNLRLFTVSVTT